MCADNAKLSREIKSFDDNEEEQEDMDELVKWADVNGMAHHPDKYNVLEVGEREITH